MAGVVTHLESVSRTENVPSELHIHAFKVTNGPQHKLSTTYLLLSQQTQSNTSTHFELRLFAHDDPTLTHCTF